MKQILFLAVMLLLTNCTQQLDSLPFKCDETADVVFILDSSGSIGLDNFMRQLSFAANFTGLMLMSASDVRFGMIQFSSSPVKEFNLNQYNNVIDLQNAIMNIFYMGSGTATDLALQMVLDEKMFSVANGGREDSPDIIITMTDGASNSQDLTAAVAEKVKASNVTMFTVGITSGVDVTELESLSSRKEYVLLANSFAMLYTLMTPLLNNTCTAIVELRENITKGRDIPDIDICQGSQYIRGVAHLPYPEDCTKVIQCYNNPLSNKTLAVIRRCPFGHFWNQQIFNCAPSWTVECPFDKCLNSCNAQSPWDSSMLDDNGTVTYPMSGKRRGYFKCINGKSYFRCCPKGSVYVPGIGCYLNRGPSEECGPEESCKEGISICKKIPVYENRTSYLDNSMVLGYYPVSCVYSDFDIVHCRCDGQILSRGQNNKSVAALLSQYPACAPLFQTQRAADCSEEVYDLPVVIAADTKLVTLTFRLSLPSPHFQVVSIPQANCQQCYSLKIWGDSDTVNFAMGNKRDGAVSQATVLWKNATGDLDIVVMMHGERLTLGVSKGDLEVVTSVEAFWTNTSFACAHHIKAQSEFKNRCILNKLEVSDCPHEFNNIYGSS